MKKQHLQKDLFIFAGDRFFEKLISLENVIKMKRKINDYMNLKNLQTFVFAYQKNTGKKVQSFRKINTILNISQAKIEEYTIKNSIVTHKRT
jgi:hypothetical protein